MKPARRKRRKITKNVPEMPAVASDSEESVQSTAASSPDPVLSVTDDSDSESINNVHVGQDPLQLPQENQLEGIDDADVSSYDDDVQSDSNDENENENFQLLTDNLCEPGLAATQGDQRPDERSEHNDSDGTASEVSVNFSVFSESEASDNDQDAVLNELSESDEEVDVGDGDSGSSDQENSEDEQEHPEHGDEPLYNGAPLTLHESLMAIFSLACSENMSGRMLSRVLTLIALHCPPNSLCVKSLYFLKKYFANLGLSLLVYHYFCSNCVYPLETKTSQCRKCNKSDDSSFFIEIPLVNQLQALFKRPRFFEDLQYRFSPSRKKHLSNIEDIYDGRIYKEQVESGFLSNPNNISFLWWSDGLKIFKSAVKSSIWPLCLVINELPYKKRIMPRNILLAGLWFGKKQPNPNVFLKPLYKSMKTFASTGYNFKLHDGSERNVKGKILSGTCDLPAKAKFMCCHQFNGEYGCSRCLQPGESFKLPNATVRVYPFSRHMLLRTHEQSKEFASQALERRTRGLRGKDAVVNGVKGPTLLSYLMPDVIRCMGIDVMHGAYLNLCKTLLSLWLSSRFSNCPWSLAHSLDIIDSRIRGMKPPSFAQRPLRTIKEAVQFWKASEYKLFLLYYSVPVLLGVMDANYYKHHCKLVSALALLSQDSISVEQVTAASELLTQYVSEFTNMYNARFLGINVHQLLHLPDVVLDLGPVWVYSCFFFESLNGTLGKLFHGTRHVATQICSSVKLYLEMPVLIELLPNNSAVKVFCENVTYKKNVCKIADKISEKIFAVGTYSEIYIARESSRLILQECLGQAINGSHLKIFYRLKKDGLLYFSEEYSRTEVSKRESSFVFFKVDDNSGVGKILRFVRWKDCSPQCDSPCLQDCECSYFCILREYRQELWYPHDNPTIRFPHLSKVKSSLNVRCISVQNLSSILFYMNVEGDEYVARPVNSVEVE